MRRQVCNLSGNAGGGGALKQTKARMITELHHQLSVTGTRSSELINLPE
jgi:hypothetical protein